MDELEQIPEIDDYAVLSTPTTTHDAVVPTSTKKRKAAPKKKKKARKPELVKRYLDNFDSSKQVPPTEDELKSMTVAKLETLCTIQEKQQTHKLQPSCLAETLIGFVSQCLDFLAQTDGEIARLNEDDQELKRCVSEELGSLATYLNNKVKIASHVALNSGRAIVKKRKLMHPKKENDDQRREEQTQAGSAKSD